MLFIDAAVDFAQFLLGVGIAAAKEKHLEKGWDRYSKWENSFCSFSRRPYESILRENNRNGIFGDFSYVSAYCELDNNL